ncbi:putative 50S ribosomal protein L23 [Trichinella spiralis]|uniref:putative 50S ribosomal protein L23 n=1 Tax=Trichinella spiralis TaxID=6334 RepID=UPI0001EFB76E|nr:putative 50S ribosomal protein L23 [Trichinella spiralis]XP_003374965.1 putative 50S ribosomal protein L23 [Trichinella spiralis]
MGIDFVQCTPVGIVVDYFWLTFAKLCEPLFENCVPQKQSNSENELNRDDDDDGINFCCIRRRRQFAHPFNKQASKQASSKQASQQPANERTNESEERKSEN